MNAKRYLAVISLTVAIVLLSIVLGKIAKGKAANKKVEKAVQSGKENDMYKKLTKEEERIIVHKGTEPPFSGKFLNHFEDGVYTCKRCGTELFRSSSKFKSDCGWPVMTIR